MALAVIGIGIGMGMGMGTRPAGAVDYMYVSLQNNTIVRYDISLATSALVQASGSVFVPSGQGLNYVTGLAFDTAGNLYAANHDGNTITRYNSSGTRIGTDFVPTGQGLSGPAGPPALHSIVLVDSMRRMSQTTRSRATIRREIGSGRIS